MALKGCVFSDAEQTLREVLSQHGSVALVTLRRRRDLRTGEDTSWALVTMETSAAAAAVLKAASHLKHQRSCKTDGFHTNDHIKLMDFIEY